MDCSNHIPQNRLYEEWKRRTRVVIEISFGLGTIAAIALLKLLGIL